MRDECHSHVQRVIRTRRDGAGNRRLINYSVGDDNLQGRRARRSLHIDASGGGRRAPPSDAAINRGRFTWGGVALSVPLRPIGDQKHSSGTQLENDEFPTSRG